MIIRSCGALSLCFLLPTLNRNVVAGKTLWVVLWSVFYSFEGVWDVVVHGNISTTLVIVSIQIQSTMVFPSQSVVHLWCFLSAFDGCLTLLFEQ